MSIRKAVQSVALGTVLALNGCATIKSDAMKKAEVQAAINRGRLNAERSKQDLVQISKKVGAHPAKKIGNGDLGVEIGAIAGGVGFVAGIAWLCRRIYYSIFS